MALNKVHQLEKAMVLLLNFEGWELEWTGGGSERWDAKGKTQKGYDCVIEMEHKLRVGGTYEKYEQTKILENKKAWLKRAEEDVKALKQAYTESQQYVTNADGLLETWNAQMTPVEFEETVEKQFTEFKKNFLNEKLVICQAVGFLGKK